MATAKTGLGVFVLTSLCLWATLGCQPGGQGDPCIPEDEYTTAFSGYDEDEVNVESRSFQCETRVCLVNHFRGRVSCPYGQTQEEISGSPENGIAPLGGDHQDRCHIPGTTGRDPVDAVAVPVRPQLEERVPDRAVYCSCRCANAKGKDDDGAKYCDCASGFTCTQLIDDLNLGSAQLAGAYCIRNGTKFDDTAPPGKSCSKIERNCGDAQPY
jgi:hypothetical protein